MVSTRRTRRARNLGQNFLVDRNILGVIERLAELDPADVVLEIGGGPGVLSERLADRVAHVHVIEIDRTLEAGLRELLGDRANVSIHIADALELDLPGLDPAPDKVVANLPYGIAATVVLRTIDELPRVQSWVVMVQREVGERLAAAPGTAAYGTPSVLAQLACEVRVLRAVSRNVFRPVPNVDSVLVGLRRTAPAAEPEVRALVHDAFAHRRKTLAGALALAPHASPEVRERAREALVAHRPPRRRARRAPGPRGVPRAGVEARRLTGLRALAPGKVNLCLFLGGVRDDGRHELVTLFESVSLADELLLRSAPRDEVVCPSIADPNLVATALSRLRELGWEGPPVRVEIDEADSGGRRHGWRLGRRGGAAAARP